MYSVWAVVALAGAIGIELLWLRTGIFRSPSYWVTLAITVAFQVVVDGWLTKLSAPIVLYNHREISGVRFPFDIPIEDFAYGVALVTLALVLWVHATSGSAAPER